MENYLDMKSKDEKTLFPHFRVRRIGSGEGYKDYLLSEVLAGRGGVIRTLYMDEDCVIHLNAYICKGKDEYSCISLSFELSPDLCIPDEDKEKVISNFRDGDIVLRYEEKGFYPTWRIIFSRRMETNGYKQLIYKPKVK